MKRLKLLAGNAHPVLAESVARELGLALGGCEVTMFSDGELSVHIQENVRGCDVFVLQPTSSPANRHIMELLLIIDALRRASAKRITAVIPYYGYARQDRKVKPRVPISSKLVADLITAAGTHRLLTIDLHAGQIQGFFNLPVDHLYATPVMLEYLRNRSDNLVVVSPDAGGVERARAFAKHLKSTIAIIDKRRERANVSEVMNVVGDVSGMDALILDDMIDTAGTITQAAAALRREGARQIFAVASHAVLSGPAIERLNESELTEVIVTDTIPLGDKGERCPKIKQLSIAPILAEAIKRIHEETSVSSLFV